MTPDEMIEIINAIKDNKKIEFRGKGQNCDWKLANSNLRYPNFAEYDHRIVDTSKYPKIRIAKMVKAPYRYYISIVDNEELATITAYSDDFIRWETDWILIDPDCEEEKSVNQIIKAVYIYIIQ